MRFLHLKNRFVAMLVCSSLLGLSCARQAGDETKGRLAPLLEGMGNLHHAITTKSETAQRFEQAWAGADVSLTAARM
jgi:hypothetical protein